MPRTHRRGRSDHSVDAANAVAEPPPDAVVFDAHHAFCIGLRISKNRRWPNVIVRIIGADASVRLQLEPSAVRIMRDLFDVFLKTLEVNVIAGGSSSTT